MKVIILGLVIILKEQGKHFLKKKCMCDEKAVWNF